jgi:2-dehydropantoate 2-reductase
MAVRVCVVGCGAIGAIFAAHLARDPELEVWAYDVGAEHVAAINRDGLRLAGARELTARVSARTDPAQIPPCALGLVASKGTITERAIAAAAAILADAAVCSVQNGIGNEEVIARHVPRVMRGVTLSAGHVSAPGVVEVDAIAQTWLGPFEPAPAAWDEIAGLAGRLSDAGLEAQARHDARGAQWTKLLFNSATNPLCALTGLSHGEMCDHPPTRAIVSRLCEEGRAVAAALGVTLDSDPEALIDSEARANYAHRPSMLQDVTGRRATEIGLLNGGIVAAGRQCGVATPTHETIVGLVTGLERSWGLHADRPRL